MDSRLEEINNLLIRYSLGDFDYSIQPSDKYDEIDAFITNINMLGEELKTSVISRDYFNNIFHSVSDMLLVLDNKGDITSINKAVSDKLRYSENQLRETSINFIAGEDSKLFEYIRSMLAKSNFINNLEVVFHSLELSAIPVSLSCSYLFNQHQVRIGYLIIARDLSKIKEYENSSKETEKKFRKVFEDSSDCFFITDSDGKFIDLNRAGFELLKCQEDIINKESFFDYIFDTAERDSFRKQINEKSVVPDCKLKIRDKENNIVDCLISANKIINEFGETKGFQGTIKNMTKQKEIENLFVRAIVDTQEKERKRIVKDLHDSLGQQLSAIKFFLSTLKSIKGKVSPEKMEELLTKSDNALNEVIAELSNICFNIMPGTLQRFGLSLKNVTPEELIKAIDTILNGSNYFSNDVAIKLLNFENTNPDSFRSRLRSSKTKIYDDLSTREMEVLKLIGEAKSNDEIAEQLSISKRTVETHKQHLLRKIGVKNTSGLIKFAIEMFQE